MIRWLLCPDVAINETATTPSTAAAAAIGAAQRVRFWEGCAPSGADCGSMCWAAARNAVPNPLFQHAHRMFSFSSINARRARWVEAVTAVGRIPSAAAVSAMDRPE